MIDLYAINTKNIENLNEIEVFFNVISEKRRAKINKFFFVKDKVHSLFAEIILRYALWEEYDLDSECIEFEESEFGKPYLVHQKDLYFNLSHSGNWVLCGLGDTPLGLDVELIRDKDLSITNRIYTQEESNYIFKQSMDNRIRVFYKIWTLKESYVKYVGKGLSIPFDTFSFRFYENDPLLYIDEKRDSNLFFWTAQLDDQHVTALCVNSHGRNKINKQFRILTIDELRKWRNV